MPAIEVLRETHVGTTYKRALTRKILARDHCVPGGAGVSTAFVVALDYAAGIASWGTTNAQAA
jgi:hypothetical protein